MLAMLGKPFTEITDWNSYFSFQVIILTEIQNKLELS